MRHRTRILRVGTIHTFGEPSQARVSSRPSGGSPFQLPTELADGLGPGSVRGLWLPRAVRPILMRISQTLHEILEETGSSASIARKGDRLRLQGQHSIHLSP